MASPFPGLDPYLESQLWADFHSRFIAALSEDLVPKVRPRYVAVIEERVYVEHDPEQPRVILRPDVTIAVDSRGHGSTSVPRAAPYRVPIPVTEPVRETYIEIRLRDNREVVTIIELLSPANKRAHSDGRRAYLPKRELVLQGTVHLVELDFLRGGERLPMAGPLPDGDGYVVVSHSAHRPMADVWPLALRERLPQIFIPLSGADPDVTADLQQVFTLVYERAGYDYALDYSRPVDPPMPPADEVWTRDILLSRPDRIS